MIFTWGSNKSAFVKPNHCRLSRLIMGPAALTLTIVPAFTKFLKGICLLNSYSLRPKLELDGWVCFPCQYPRHHLIHLSVTWMYSLESVDKYPVLKKRCPGYDTKLYLNGEAPVLEICGVFKSVLLALLSPVLLLEVVVPVWVPSMG